jgi:uncharacterized cupin superfamily protein
MSEYKVTELGGIDEWVGKSFIQGEIGADTVGISVNATEPGDSSPFWHSHAESEEIYIVLDGRGEISVGADTVALKAGTVVRVAPSSKLALRALPDSATPLKWLCIRSGANTIEAIGNDATLDQETPGPWTE